MALVEKGAQANAVGRSRGGLTTKVHLVVDALGLPLDFEVTQGQRHDIVPAPELVGRTQPQCHDNGCETVIPSRAKRTNPQEYDKELYKARSEVECTFNLLEQARRFATRYEKTLRNYTAVVAIGCAMLWLRI